MAVQRFELDVDPNFEIHTSYHNDFFLLRTRVLVDGENAEVRSVKEGKYEGPVLNFRQSDSTIGTKLRLIASIVSPILVQYGIYHVDTFYYEQSPLFHVVFSSQSCLKNFILAIEDVKSAVEAKLQSLFLKSVLRSESPQQLTVEVQLDLFLVSPDRQETKGAEVNLVTAENCSDFVTRWKDSKLFDFGALYQEKAKPPKVRSHPMSQKDVLPGKAVAFSVEATGTLPLKFQWQWKQFGKKGEKDGWQNLSGDSGTFQVGEIQACNAGNYRCVVSNCAGSETSQCASFTVVPEVRDLDCELYEVIDWFPLGLHLGIKLPELKIIEKNYPNDLKMCRIEMFDKWQKNVTPTWSAIVQALVGIGMRRLASELAQKHGAPPPKLPDSDPLGQLENIPQQEGGATATMLHEELQKHKGDQLERDHRKLVDAEDYLRDVQETKVKANQKVSEAVTKLEELKENVEKISEEKSNLERELKIKEQECQLLSAMQEKDAYNQVLQKKIDKKRKKIKSLRKELARKESELQFSMQKVETIKEQLSQAQKGLKKQHKEVIQLQREKEELACSYNIEKEQVSKIVQLLVSDKEEMQQQLNNMKDESKFKSKQIEARDVEIHHLSEEIEALSSTLQEKEAVAAQLQSELQTCQQVASAPEQLLGLLKVTTQIAELECKLQEAEEQKQKAELERDATVQEMKAKENLRAQLHAHFNEPPKVTSQPESLSKACPETAASFAVQATGTEPLRYFWEHKPSEEEVGSEEWQPCPSQWSDGATLTIPSVQKSNEGSYHCVISNYAGTRTSNPAKLSVADPPRITAHPQELKGVAAGQYAMFSVEATGTGPLSYKWERNPAGERRRTEEWQPCDLEGFPGADSSTVTIHSVQKSNEGSYHCVVSNCAGNQISNSAELEVCLPLQLPLQLRWRRCSDMECAMTEYPHCVVLERSVYVGGGYTVYGDDNQHTIQVYNIDTDNWSHLPRYQYKRFAISIVNSRLTLVGGYDGLDLTNQLAVYEPSSQHWTYPYHPMPTPRFSPAVVMYDIWLLVAGGCADGGHKLATVELFNTSTNQWLATASLPTPCSWLTSATVNNYGYIVTQNKQVFHVSLPDIVSQTVDQSIASKSPALWSRLPDTPLERSTAISLRGYLIAVGGRHDNRTRTDIHLYQPESEQWTKVGNLPNARESCSCVVLPSGELLVAGGRDSSLKRNSRVDVASILN